MQRESALVRVSEARPMRACSNAPFAISARLMACRCSRGRCRGGLRAFLLPRAFLPPFNEGTFTINMLFNPGISLAESQPRRPDCRAAHPGGARSQDRRPAHRPRRTRRACRRRPFVRDRSRPQAVERGQDRDHRRYPRRGSRCFPLSINVGQPISHRLDHMLSGVRAEIALKIFGDDLDTLAQHRPKDLRSRLVGIPGLTDLQVEKQVLHSATGNPRRLRPRRALRRAAGRRRRAAQPPVQRTRGLARRRRLPPLRCGDAAAGLACAPRNGLAIC